MNNDQLLGLSPIRLQMMLRDLGRPGVDKHAEELKWRATR